MEMSDTIKNALAEIKETVGNGEEMAVMETAKCLAPSGTSWFRAALSLIPYAGGALDHLLFDKYASIQQKNIEQAVNAMQEKMATIDEQKVSKEWFESEEALDMLRNLLQKIVYEADGDKIRTLSKVFCLFGTKEHEEDHNKYAVLQILSSLSNNQRVIFKAIYEMPLVEKTVGGNIRYTVNARWQTEILKYCNTHPEILSQLNGQVTLDLELDVLLSYNLITNMVVPINEDVAYKLSPLGHLAYGYLKEA